MTVPAEDVFYVHEQGAFESETVREYVESLGLPPSQGTGFMGVPRYLGISSPDYKASYYIGAEWLPCRSKAVVVLPKMDGIDYVRMFLSALSHAPSAEYFSRCYGIDLEAPKIEANSVDNILSPLLMAHYLTAVKALLAKGLKRGYVQREENLHSKIKGRVMMSRHMKQNVSVGRADRVWCAYQEYSEDIPENRLLKKALLFVRRMASTLPALEAHGMSGDLTRMVNASLAAFAGVSDDVDPSAVRTERGNVLFGDYKGALKLAKTILRRYDYSIANVEAQSNKVPPFWIDMSRLYEVYVYSILDKAYPGAILFQAPGSWRTAADYLKTDERMVMDAKYKPRYAYTNEDMIDDVREMSGYARDRRILAALGVGDDPFIPPCLVIYPVYGEGGGTLQSLSGPILPQATPVREFKEFYKIGIKVPMLK